MSRGRLRVYLGAAPGVGKTFAMLSEGSRRASRGTDVVVGVVETHCRPSTVAQLEGLEVIPRRTLSYRGAELEEMDVDAILARAPQVVLVDELAHTNAPGSRHEKRWQDVDLLLDAGIDVITTVNVQHLESLNDVVESITGIRQRETVPDLVVRRADQVELVDMTPEALRRRMAHGNIYAAEKVDAALTNYFRVGNLSALRELALLWVADKVDDTLQQYMADHHIAGTWETRERVVVAVTGAPSGEQLIRRAGRMAQRAHADLLGVHVHAGGGLTTNTSDLLEQHRSLLHDLGGEYHEIVADDVASGLAGFARSARATQLVLGSTQRNRWNELLHGSIINRVIRLSGEIDVHVISYEAETTNPTGMRLPARPRSSLPSRRQLAGWIIGSLGLLAITLLLHGVRDEVGLSSVLLLYLLLVCLVATTGGLRPALATSITGSMCANWFFTQPYGTLRIDDPEQVLAVVALVASGTLVSVLVGMTARHASDAQRVRAEAAALASVGGWRAEDTDFVAALLAHLRITFGQDSVALFRSTSPDSWEIEGFDGLDQPDSPAAGVCITIAPSLILTLVPGVLSVEDRRFLDAYAARAGEAIERHELETAAVESDLRNQADELRVAILRAVSHDLRSPLASIKASSTSLLQVDIDWSPEQITEFATTIDEEADRLDHLVTNLLDVSRIEAGVVKATTREVGLEDVISAALDSLSIRTTQVVVDIADDLPTAIADAGLLERVVANVVANALEHATNGSTIHLEATSFRDRAIIRIIDHGPGVDDRVLEQMFEPFQRLGDTSLRGVGLGLAVAKGFTEAMHGELTTEHTPGGGLTVNLALPLAPSGPAGCATDPAAGGAP